MSRQLASRHSSFAQPGCATQPVVPPRRSRASLTIEAIRSQEAAVKLADGAIALYTAMRPSERRLTETAIKDSQYTVSRLSSGMPVYVVQPPAAQPQAAQSPAIEVKPKLSKQQRAAAEKKLLAEAAAAKQSAKPKRARNRHDDLAAARAMKQVATGQ